MLTTLGFSLTISPNLISESDPDLSIKINKFWSWAFQPISLTAMALSFVLIPRRNDWVRKFLIGQYFVYAILPTLFSVVVNKSLSSVLQLLVYSSILPLVLRVRANIAVLEDKVLADFLSEEVFNGGVMASLAQLTFLLFSSVQCERSENDWRQCNRTLYSQTGLGKIVSLYIMSKIIFSIFPEVDLERREEDR